MTVSYCLYNFGNGAEGDFVMQCFMYCNAEAVVCSLTIESPSNAGHAKGQQIGRNVKAAEGGQAKHRLALFQSPSIAIDGGESLVFGGQGVERATSTPQSAQDHVKEQDGSHPS